MEDSSEYFNVELFKTNAKKLAVFSDVHANLPALEAVLSDLQSRPHDAIICLGDIVGYYTKPIEVPRA